MYAKKSDENSVSVELHFIAKVLVHLPKTKPHAGNIMPASKAPIIPWNKHGANDAENKY